MAYLSIARFKIVALIPSGWVDEVEGMAAGFTDAQLDVGSDFIDAQLRKRYAAPFAAPVPGVIELWLARLVTPDIMVKRGVNATDEQFQYMVARQTEAKAEIQSAADSEKGLYDLPLRDDVTGTGITYGSPRSYSEQSPYVYNDVQVDTAHAEDQARRGSGV